MTRQSDVLKAALSLAPVEKAELVDHLLRSLDNPDKEIDQLWAKEAENRIDAFERGKLKAISLEKVLEKY